MRIPKTPDGLLASCGRARSQAIRTSGSRVSGLKFYGWPRLLGLYAPCMLCAAAALTALAPQTAHGQAWGDAAGAVDSETYQEDTASDAIPRRGLSARGVDISAWGETSATYSDNVNLSSGGGRKSGWIGTVSAGTALSAQTDRATGALNYSVAYDHDFTESQGDFRHDLTASGAATVVPDLLYLDAQGSINEVYYNADNRFSGNPAVGRTGRSRSYYGSISPAVRRSLGGWATAEARYRRNQTIFEDSGAADNHANIYSASLTSDPRRFSRFNWSVAGALTSAGVENSDTARKHWTGSVSVAAPLTPKATITAAAGYDRYEDINYDNDLDGAYGNVGLTLRPSSRLSASGRLGYRYNGLDYGLGVNYALAQRLALAISAGRTVQFNDYGGSPVQLFGAGNDPNGAPLFRAAGGGTTTNLRDALAVNTLTGVRGAFGDPAVSNLDSDAVVDSLSIAVAGQSRRMTYGAALTAEQRDYGSVAPGEQILSGSIYGDFAATDRLTLEASAGLSLYKADTSGGPDHSTVTVGVGASWRVTEIINAFARYTYTQRFADDSVNEYRENAVTLGLRAEF